jgi:rhomboid family protein
MIPIRDTIRSNTRPYVTTLIIAVNVLVFLFTVSLEPYTRNEFLITYGLVPARFHLLNVFTSMFLHGGWMHIIFNMWVFWIYGDNVEDVLGHGKYLIFYFLCGLAAAMTQYAISPGSHLPLVGASGAIAGVMGAYMVKFPRARIVTLIFVFIFFTTVDIPAVVILAYWFVLQIFSSAGSIGNSQGGVAFFAHIGGFITGIVLVFLMGTRQRYRKRADVYW